MASPSQNCHTHTLPSSDWTGSAWVTVTTPRRPSWSHGYTAPSINPSVSVTLVPVSFPAFCCMLHIKQCVMKSWGVILEWNYPLVQWNTYSQEPIDSWCSLALFSWRESLGDAKVALPVTSFFLEIPYLRHPKPSCSLWVYPATLSILSPGLTHPSIVQLTCPTIHTLNLSCIPCATVAVNTLAIHCKRFPHPFWSVIVCPAVLQLTSPEGSRNPHISF